MGSAANSECGLRAGSSASPTGGGRSRARCTWAWIISPCSCAVACAISDTSANVPDGSDPASSARATSTASPTARDRPPETADAAPDEAALAGRSPNGRGRGASGSGASHSDASEDGVLDEAGAFDGGAFKERAINDVAAPPPSEEPRSRAGPLLVTKPPTSTGPSMLIGHPERRSNMCSQYCSCRTRQGALKFHSDADKAAADPIDSPSPTGLESEVELSPQEFCPPQPQPDQRRHPEPSPDWSVWFAELTAGRRRVED